MIDVLIPVYNAETTVREAILSILRQTVDQIHVVAIDDGSTDGTPDILADLARSDHRMTVIRKTNSGIVDALNLGLEHCQADIVARHDADDIAFPRRFATQLAYLDANPDCLAVGANVWHIDVRGRRMGSTRLSEGEALCDCSAVPAFEPYLIHPFLMVRRSALVRVGGYRHVFNAEDSDLYWRLREFGRLHNLGEMLGEYRIHAGSITSGSVVSARIGAVTSQQAALSARRRSLGQPDLQFSSQTVGRYRSARNFPAILEIAAEQLSPAEAQWLRVAASAKLLELRNYRPFKLSVNDIRTTATIIGRSWQQLGPVDRRNIFRNTALNIRPKFGLKKLYARMRARFS